MAHILSHRDGELTLMSIDVPKVWVEEAAASHTTGVHLETLEGGTADKNGRLQPSTGGCAADKKPSEHGRARL
jgi:hypothetical protein